MSTTGEDITLKYILNARCPIPQLTIAAYLTQRIVRKIEQRIFSMMIWDLTDLGSIFGTALESVMHRVYQSSLEMLDSCNQQVPSALTDHYTELISELEGIERKLDDQKAFDTMALCWRQTITTEAPMLNSMIKDWLEEAAKMPLEPSKKKHVQRNQVNFEQEELVELNTATQSDTARIPTPIPSSGAYTGTMGDASIVINCGNTTRYTVIRTRTSHDADNNISQSSSSSMINIEGEDSTTGIKIDDNSQVIQTNLAINSDRGGQVINETNFEERRMSPSAMNKDNEEILIEESNDIEEKVKPALDASEGNQVHDSEVEEQATPDTFTQSTQETNTTSELLSSAEETDRRPEDARTRPDEDHVDGSTTSFIHIDDQGRFSMVENSQNCIANGRHYPGTGADESRPAGGRVCATGQNVFISNCGNNITTIQRDGVRYRRERRNGVDVEVAIMEKEEEQKRDHLIHEFWSSMKR